MKELYNKYAHLLLEKGLYMDKGRSLVINAPVEAIQFVRELTDVALSMGVDDIYFDWYDAELKATELKYFNFHGIKNSLFWNKSVYDDYVKKDAGFLFLASYTPGILNDIDSKKMKVASETSLNTRKLYRKMQRDNKIDWCIAGVATEKWSKLLFPNDDNSLNKLWDLIFDICLIKEDNPILEWNKKITNNKKLCDKLTNLQIKELHYKNSIGTNFTVELSKGNIWCGGSSTIKGRCPIVNIPSEEVFTTPNKFKTNGIVYASKPLIHSGVMIKDICLEFKDGKIVNYNASQGYDELKNIIESTSECDMLGEVALVDKNSKISKSGVLFYETLYDENAACHIALGGGFKECLLDGDKLSDSELEERGYNKCSNHVDMMIGTDDLLITIKTYDNKELVIFKDGSFNI